ncbi:MAG: sigma-70 family RNA polymerase sigma factor [Ginsengibacter sp.]
MPHRLELVNIIEGCIHAKRESQKELYKKFYGFSMGICMRYCNQTEDTVEIVNDGFLKIFNSLHSFQPKYENIEVSFMGWIKKIMINTAIDQFRKNKKFFVTTDICENEFAINGLQESFIDKLSYKEIIQVVQRLSPVYRTVFNLYVIDGYKHEDIAQQLNISIGTSKSNLSKAKINIQKMLAEVDIKNYEKRAI